MNARRNSRIPHEARRTGCRTCKYANCHSVLPISFVADFGFAVAKEAVISNVTKSIRIVEDAEKAGGHVKAINQPMP